MKCIIDSVSAYEAEWLIDSYGKKILSAGFTLERLDETEDHEAGILVELQSMEDLKKLAEVVENNIVFEAKDSFERGYPRLTIYDDYLE